MFIPRHILQNILMGLGPVRRLAMRFHSTGMSGDEAAARRTFELFSSLMPVEGRNVLEIGPGQTIEMLPMALAAGARSCSAVDIAPYISPETARSADIDYRITDGTRIPFGDGAFDVVWASDVLEHVRRPSELLDEVARVLSPGGGIVCSVDLRDHYHLSEESRWLDCFKYSDRLWRAMTSNRSNYVNRLRLSDWRRLFAKAGLEESELRAKTLASLVDISRSRPYLRHLSEEDAATYRFEARFVKPCGHVREASVE